MLKSQRYMLVRPKCRYCGLDWTPPIFVSADLAYCDVCKDERLWAAAQQQEKSKVIIGRNGQKRLMPA